MEEKWVTIRIGGYPRRCPESRLQAVMEHIEKLKKMYMEKGASKETVEKAYNVEIVRDED